LLYAVVESPYPKYPVTILFEPEARFGFEPVKLAEVVRYTVKSFVKILLFKRET
jgi:hypothetical protein